MLRSRWRPFVVFDANIKRISFAAVCWQKKIAQLYKRQSVRRKCKACQSKLKGQKFINHNIEYIQCKICTHVNGRFNDTENFSKTIYESSNINYSKTYKSDNYKKFLARQKKIYNPKADFLKNGLNFLSLIIKLW